MGTIPGRFVAAVVIALVGTALAGCSGVGDGAGSADDAPPTEPATTRLEQALHYLAPGGGPVAFFDRTAFATRLGLEDLETGAPDADVARWFDAARAEDFLLENTKLTNYLRLMQDATFSEFDVEWQLAETRAGTTVLRMSDDLDLDEVADDLVAAGFEPSGPKARPILRPDLARSDDNGMLGGRYPSIELWDVALVPEKHLIVTGHHVAEALEVIDGETESLADAGTYDALLALDGDPATVEYAGLTGGTCTLDGEDAGGSGAALFLHPDSTVRWFRAFATATAAQDDATALGAAVATEKPDRKALSVRADGAVVRIEAAFADRVQLTTSYRVVEGRTACSGTVTPDA
ncbi:hypothetical protein [Nocardioides nitrophenolicus]|uniref:hypothetical protein n=1 Tax=Nocardioides nitrophenolicus TaxID=60489 RepID=UPI0019573FC1|nr:hypothetical protein [Nocardioides nitrophenolicus]MBM7516138.1 hypothetical protein [Nocardioides nitrophenolicus]